MKISESWLRDWVNPPLSTHALTNQLTMAGLEVDAVEPVAGMFSGVVVARVMATRPHPQADRLTLCEVDPGNGQLIAVVCGAVNVRPGLTVALATLGAQLPGDFIIKESKLRGELSQGMLCAASELGLVDSFEGIMELADDAPLGIDLRVYLQLEDHILDLDLTPNRADCLSILGVAREVAALNQLPLQPIASAPIKVTTNAFIPVHLAAPAACPMYAGRFIIGINPEAATPLTIKERLRRSDIRPTHPVVDVLNYVMLELGQPLHAFDRQSITSDIHVRYAHQNESIIVLNGQTCQLDEHVLVIADDERALAIAGVMGGALSAVQAHTTDIWLESAYFDPRIIAGVARRFGLSSDAAHRFERGVDPALPLIALETATTLLQSIMGGEIGPVVQQQTGEWPPKPIMIVFRPNQVLRLTGVAVAEDIIEAILVRLGMSVRRHAAHWEVMVPTYRVDLRLEVDLVEEVIRMVGYDHIPIQAIDTVMHAGTTDPIEQLSRQMIVFLAHRGYRETISYSFVDPQLQQVLYPNTPVKSLLNPISSELADMRIGLWPGLLASMLHNIHRQQPALRLAETGKVFLATDSGAVTEMACCAGLITGERGQFNWNDVSAKYDFYDMKGDLEALFATTQLDRVSFIPGEHPALHPGKTAQIMHADQPIGWLGALHPRLLNALDLTQEVIVFEIQLSTLTTLRRAVYQTISKYPHIRRDLSLCLDEQVRAEDLERVVREVVDSSYLKDFYVFDVYTDATLAANNKKSMAIGLMLQSDVRTLQDEEVQTMMTAVILALEKQLSAVLRTTTTH